MNATGGLVETHPMAVSIFTISSPRSEPSLFASKASKRAFVAGDSFGCASGSSGGCGLDATFLKNSNNFPAAAR